MQLPKQAASYRRRVEYGRYVARRLRAGGFVDLSESVKAATSKVKNAGRGWEDATEPVQDGMADRDQADDVLDTCAQEARLALASRSLTAEKDPPYTQIFPQGIGYYTAALQSEQTSRYRELASRLTELLAEDDPVRTGFVPRIEAGVSSYETAVTALNSARSSEALARSQLDTAEDEWDVLLERVYGTLVAEVSKAGAERFFPRVNRRASSGSSETD